MSGSTISILFISFAFAFLVFALAYIIASLAMSNKIAAEKRLDELKKKEGDFGELALVKSESKKTRAQRIKKQQKNKLSEKIGSILYDELKSADIKMRPEEYAIIWILVAFLPGALCAMFTSDLTISLVLVVAGVVAPLMAVKIKQKQRVKKFDSQLSDALMIACSCLKSGLSFNKAMENIAKDMEDPIGYEFGVTIQEVNMGYSMDEAMRNLGKRINSKQLNFMISAVLVQRQTGGNLSQILNNISNTIREREKMQKELKTSTASGKMSGIMVGVIPIALTPVFILSNSDMYGMLLTETRGRMVLLVAIVLEALAFISIKKITTVKM